MKVNWQPSLTRLLVAILAVVITAQVALAVVYPYETAEPQKTGWPLTAEERSYVVDKPEHERRPGRESNKHLPAMWPVVPSAGHWGGTAWLDTHAKLVHYVQANKGAIDILLVGDSITQQWGSPLDKGVLNDAWKQHFGGYKTINIGFGGDKAQNVLWRVDHGAEDGLEPRLVVMMIGNNNMFFTPETGIEAAAKGVQMCVANVRDKFPAADVIVAKILPSHAPGIAFYEDIKKTNAALVLLKLDSDPKVRVLDLTSEFLNADGTIKKSLVTPDNIHLSLAGYGVYAERLKPLIDKSLGGKGVGGAVIIPTLKPSEKTPTPATPAKPTTSTASAAPAVALSQTMLQPTPKTADGKSLVYPYTPYMQGKLDPQLTGWPLSDAEKAWVSKGEYFRKPGHELQLQKHLPEMWFVTPAAAHWQPKDGGQGNAWIEHHATCIEKLLAAKSGIDVVLLGDSITQGWGGGWDGAPFNDAWKKHFGDLKTINLGIGGDRIENILWRLDHGALDGASPAVTVLLIGVNNAPLVQANEVPAAAAAQGIKLCIENLRMRCPQSHIILVKILPAFDPTKEVGAKVREINTTLDTLKLDIDANVSVVDLWNDFTNTDGSLEAELYSDKHLHLSPAGYEVLAAKLKPSIQELLVE